MQSADWGSLCPTNFCPLLPINCPLLPPTLQRPIQPFSWSADFFHTKACEEASKIWTADSHGWLGVLSTVTARQRRSVIVYLYQHLSVSLHLQRCVENVHIHETCTRPLVCIQSFNLLSHLLVWNALVTLLYITICNYMCFLNLFGNILTLRKHDSSRSKKSPVLTYVLVLTYVTVSASVWLMVLTHFIVLFVL